MKEYLGENQSCKNTNISYFINGKNLNPKEITNALGIEPTKSFSKGDEIVTKSHKRNAVYGQWAVETKGKILSTSTEAHAKLLLEILYPQRHALKKYLLNSDLRISISIWWEGLGYHGGYTISCNTMKMLSEIANEIDYYFISSEED